MFGDSLQPSRFGDSLQPSLLLWGQKQLLGVRIPNAKEVYLRAQTTAQSGPALTHGLFPALLQL